MLSFKKYFMPSKKAFSSDELTNGYENRVFLITALAWKGSVSPKILPRVIWIGIYTLAIVWIAHYFPGLHLSITPFEYSGAVLGLLLVARVNAGLDRWWEARKIWGSIVNQSRNLAIIGNQYSSDNNPLIAPFLRWVALWPYAMRNHLRGETQLLEADRLVKQSEKPDLVNARHIPMYIGAKIASLLKGLRRYELDHFCFHRAERERALLIDAIGACERIKNTPIPLVLAIKTRRFILLFVALLPFALVDEVNWLSPLIAMLTAYPLFCLDEIGVELQSPFSQKSLSHLPLDTVCENIEQNVLALETYGLSDIDIDEAELPTAVAQSGAYTTPELNHNF